MVYQQVYKTPREKKYCKTCREVIDKVKQTERDVKQYLKNKVNNPSIKITWEYDTTRTN